MTFRPIARLCVRATGRLLALVLLPILAGWPWGAADAAIPNAQAEQGSDCDEPDTPRGELIHAGVRAGFAWARQFEFFQMANAVLRGSDMGPGDGWFHPSRSKYGWEWLSYHFDKNHDGKITRAEFGGPEHIFKLLDRNRDGVLTAADFSWAIRLPPKMPKRPGFLSPAEIFKILDADEDGTISVSEWLAAFEYLSAGKDHLEMRDLAMMFGASPKPKNAGQDGPAPKPKNGDQDGPSREVLLRGLFNGELGSPCEGPEVGDLAPDFTLATQDGKQQIRLSRFRGRKPVVLIFGSFT